MTGGVKVKKFLLLSLPMMLSASLFGCNHTEDAKAQNQSDKKTMLNSELHLQKFIIRDNVNDPIPPEVQSVEAMPNNSGPQLIPKADPNKPIVITKMPFSKKTNENLIEVNEIHENREIPLPNGHGCVKLKIEQHAVDVLVVAQGLSPEKTYSISVVSNDHGGVTFGPKENVKIQAGEMIGDITFRPNAKGELFVSMVNPIRIFQGAQEFRIMIKSEDVSLKIVETEPFTIQLEE